MEDRRRKQREYMRVWTANWRQRAHEALGGKCLHCGFADARALQIDHVAGGGAKELRAGRRKGSIGTYYKRVLVAAEQGTGEFQLLCANCNWIKRHENDEIPRIA